MDNDDIIFQEPYYNISAVSRYNLQDVVSKLVKVFTMYMKHKTICWQVSVNILYEDMSNKFN